MTFAQRFEAVLTLTLIGVLGCIGLWKLPSVIPAKGGDWILWRTELAEDLAQAMPHTSIARASYGYLEHDILGQGLKGVLIGKNRTLFSNQDLPQFRAQALAIEAELIEFITASTAQIRTQGTDVVLVLLPDKRRVLSDLFPYFIPPWLAERYNRVAQALEGQGIELVRADQALLTLGPDGFLKNDTHWSLMGAEAVAAQVGAYVRQAYPHLTNTSLYERDDNDLEILDWQGDLRSFIPLSPSRVERVYGLETLARPYIFASDDINGAPAITLVGTSYTGFRNAEVDDPWIFVDFLKYELGADISLCSDWGEGVEEPFSSYWQRVEQKSILAPDLLIWEVPERYFGHRVDPAEIKSLGSLFETADDTTCD